MPTWGQTVTIYDFDKAAYKASLDRATGKQEGYYNYNLSCEFMSLDVDRVDIQDQGDIRVHPTSAGVVRLFSTSANDTLMGTGARKVLVAGLGDDFSPGEDGGPWVEEVVDMDGVNDAFTTKEFLRVNSIEAFDPGSLGVNSGTIDAYIGANLQLRMSVDGVVGNSISKSCHLSIPRGYVGLVREGHVGWSANQAANLWFGFVAEGLTKYPISKQVTGEGIITFGHVAFPPRCRLVIQAARVSGAAAEPIDFQTEVLVLKI